MQATWKIPDDRGRTKTLQKANDLWWKRKVAIVRYHRNPTKEGVTAQQRFKINDDDWAIFLEWIESEEFKVNIIFFYSQTNIFHYENY